MTDEGAPGPDLHVGESRWQWLHDSPEWDRFTLLFMSITREAETFELGLWEVWDEGDPNRSVTTFQPSDADLADTRGPHHRLSFTAWEDAVIEAEGYGATRDGFGSLDAVQESYREALGRRKGEWNRQPPVVSRDPRG